MRIILLVFLGIIIFASIISLFIRSYGFANPHFGQTDKFQKLHFKERGYPEALFPIPYLHCPVWTAYFINLSMAFNFLLSPAFVLVINAEAMQIVALFLWGFLLYINAIAISSRAASNKRQDRPEKPKVNIVVGVLVNIFAIVVLCIKSITLESFGPIAIISITPIISLIAWWKLYKAPMDYPPDVLIKALSKFKGQWIIIPEIAYNHSWWEEQKFNWIGWLAESELKKAGAKTISYYESKTPEINLGQEIGLIINDGSHIVWEEDYIEYLNQNNLKNDWRGYVEFIVGNCEYSKFEKLIYKHT